MLDQVPPLNAAVQLTCKVATVLAARHLGAPDTSSAFFAAIMAVLVGNDDSGFRDLPDKKGVSCKGSQAALGSVFWPDVTATDVVAEIKQIQGPLDRSPFALAWGNTLKDICNQLAQSTFVLRRRQLADLVIFLLRDHVAQGQHIKVMVTVVSAAAV